MVCIFHLQNRERTCTRRHPRPLPALPFATPPPSWMTKTRRANPRMHRQVTWPEYPCDPYRGLRRTTRSRDRRRDSRFNWRHSGPSDKKLSLIAKACLNIKPFYMVGQKNITYRGFQTSCQRKFAIAWQYFLNTNRNSYGYLDITQYYFWLAVWSNVW